MRKRNKWKHYPKVYEFSPEVRRISQSIRDELRDIFKDYLGKSYEEVREPLIRDVTDRITTIVPPFPPREMHFTVTINKDWKENNV